MNKKSLLWILLDLVFVVVFNVVFFMFGGPERPASVWVSYVFIMLSYVMLVITPYLIRKSDHTVLGLSVYSISSAYFIIEFITGLVFVFLKTDNTKIAVAVQLVIAGLYLVVLISALIANEHTIDNTEIHEIEVAYIKESTSRIKVLMGRTDDKKFEKELERLYDLMKTSPTKTHPDVFDIETDIWDNISLLEQNINKGNLQSARTDIQNITNLVKLRNQKLKAIQK